MPRRIGVTMRVETHDGTHRESRDALARDWAALFATALPEAAWLPVPNLGEAVVDFAERWALDAVLLTGGNDLGSRPDRDSTEFALLAHCIARGFPVLGVCRGLQLVQAYCGGPVAPAHEMHHGGCSHEILASSARGRELLGGDGLHAPSYHRHGVHRDELATSLEAFAFSPDGVVEGLVHRSAPVTAVQWHPERPLPDPGVAVRLLRATLG